MNTKLIWERWFLHPLATEIVQDIQANPSAWCANKYSVDKVGTTFRVWTCNGWWFCRVHGPCEQRLGVIGRTKVWAACKPYIKAMAREQKNNIRDSRLAANLAALRGES